MTRAIPFAACLAVLTLGAGAAAAACVGNGTDQTLFFTIEARTDAARTGATLGPGETLCLPGAGDAVFTAFASQTSVEGCPRLSGPDGRERLVAFLPADSCRWASHGE